MACGQIASFGSYAYQSEMIITDLNLKLWFPIHKSSEKSSKQRPYFSDETKVSSFCKNFRLFCLEINDSLFCFRWRTTRLKRWPTRCWRCWWRIITMWQLSFVSTYLLISFYSMIVFVLIRYFELDYMKTIFFSGTTRISFFPAYLCYLWDVL